MNQKPTPRNPLWLLALLPLVGGLAWWLWPSPQPSPPKAPPRPFEAPRNAPDPASWFDRAAPFSALFRGSAACQTCHAKEHSLWADHPHASALQKSSKNTVLGDFHDHTFDGDGISAKMTQQGDTFSFILPEGAQEVSYVIGRRRSQEYLTQLPDGRLQILPLSYSIRAKRWFAPLSLMLSAIPPESPFYWKSSRRTFNRECFDCHVTGMEVRYDTIKDRYDTTWIEPGVACESCHGPGASHSDKPSADNIINPKKLSQERQLALCGRCHSARVMHFSQFNSENTFFPGDLYEDYFSPVSLGQIGPNGGPSFYPDARPKEPGLEYQSLLQSRCYQASQMTCSTCHSDHQERTPSTNEVCGGCHAKQYQDISSHSKHKPVGEAALCVSCHMPKLVPSLAGATTDHTIDIPNPDNTRDFDIPSACVQCHSDEPALWSSKQFRFLYGADALSRRSDLAKLFVAAGDAKSAKQAEEALITLLQNKRESGFVRAIAVSALRSYRSKRSTGALIDALIDQDVWVRANAASGLALLGRDNRTPAATSALRSALKDKSLWVRLQAALSLYAFGEAVARETVEAWVADTYPRWYRLRALLAVNAAQRNLPDFAQEEIRVALFDKPDFIEMYRLLASVFTQKNEPERAKEALQMLLRFDPSDAEAKRALSQ